MRYTIRNCLNLIVYEHEWERWINTAILSNLLILKFKIYKIISLNLWSADHMLNVGRTLKHMTANLPI